MLFSMMYHLHNYVLIIILLNVESRNITVLDWSSDHHHLPGQFGSSQMSLSEKNAWHSYINSFIAFRLRAGINTMFDVSTSLISYSGCIHGTDHIIFPTTEIFKAPCHRFKFQPLVETNSMRKIWFVYVNPNFIINLGIHKGFVPYNHRCMSDVSYIAVNEGKYQYFCMKCGQLIS